jgi:acyl-homoserine-lactone acylase
MDVAWGEVNRLRRDGLDLPGNGGPGDPCGIFRVIGFVPDKDGKSQSVGGDSYIAAIEFSNPVRAMALIGYGNSTQPDSPHRTDQPPLSRKQLRPVWRTRQEVEAHAVERKAF